MHQCEDDSALTCVFAKTACTSAPLTAAAVLQVTVDCLTASAPPPTSVHPDISHVHFSAAEIDARTREMGREIAAAYTGVDDLLVLGVRPNNTAT